MRYTVWIVSPKGYIHSQGFESTALTIAATIRDMGYECGIAITPDACLGRTIILGGHLLQESDPIPNNAIIYNLEQLPNNVSAHYLSLMQTHETWDYSKINIAWLKIQGITATHVPVGYHRILEDLPAQEDKTIPILFYGCINERRKRILDEVGATSVFGVFGAELKALIAKSKIVLNVHYYENKIFEITRCGYLFANKVCVVSENGLEGDYPTGGFCPMERIAEWCDAMLRNDALRERVALAGYEEFKKTPMVVPV